MFDFDDLEVQDPATIQDAPGAGASASRSRPPSSPFPFRHPFPLQNYTSVLPVEIEVATIGAGVVERFKLPLSSSVDDVKGELEKRRGVPAVEQRLLLGTDVLEGATVLKELAPRRSGPMQITLVQVKGAQRVAVSGGREGALLVWDLRDGLPMQRLAAEDCHPTCLSFAWQRRRMLSGCSDGLLRMWDLQKAAVVGTLRGHSAGVACLAADWEAQRAVSGCEDGTLRFWDLDSCSTVTKLTGHTGPVLCVDFTAQVEESRDQDKTDIQIGRLISRAPVGGARRAGADWPAKGPRAVTGGMDCKLIVWDLDSGELLTQLSGHIMPANCVVGNFDARPDPVAVAGTFGILRIWTLASFPFYWDFRAQSAAVTCLALEWSTLSIVCGSTDTTLLVGRLQLNRNTIEEQRLLRGHNAPVTSVVASWPRHRAVSGAEDGMVRIWDLAVGSSLQELRGHSDGVLCVGLSLEGPDEEEEELEAGDALELQTSLTNLAKGCDATASSSKSADRSPWFAVDGRRDTRWTSAYADEQWLCVDLASVCKLSRVDVKWESAFAQSFSLQGSLDGQEWTVLAADLRGRPGWVATVLPVGTTARWVRLRCHRRATQFGFSVFALCVYQAEATIGPGAFDKCLSHMEGLIKSIDLAP